MYITSSNEIVCVHGKSCMKLLLISFSLKFFHSLLSKSTVLCVQGDHSCLPLHGHHPPHPQSEKKNPTSYQVHDVDIVVGKNAYYLLVSHFACCSNHHTVCHTETEKQSHNSRVTVKEKSSTGGVLGAVYCFPVSCQ